MHLLLVDQMICPRCGPEFGLILLADKIQDRRVLEGFLGCSNCRDKFPVADGCGDLRPHPRSQVRREPQGVSSKLPGAMEMAALLGLTGGHGNVGLIGDMSNRIRALTQIITSFEFVGIRHEMFPSQEFSDLGRGSRLVVGEKMPFRDGCFRGLAVSGKEDGGWVLEIARIVRTTGRVVIWESTKELIGILENEGLCILMKQEDVVVLSPS